MSATDVLMLETSGTCHYTFLLCSALAAAGVRPHLVTRDDWELAGRPRVFPVSAVLAARQPYATSLTHVARLVRATRPSVVHVQTLLSTRKDAVLFALLRALGPRVVFTAHNGLPHEADWLDRLGHWGIYHGAHHVIVHNQATRAFAAGTYRVAARHLSVIPHGDYALFADGAPTREAARARLGVPSGERRVLFFGAIRPYKGLDVLVEAFASLRASVPAARLVVAGKVLGGDIEVYRRRVRELGMDGLVTFIDHYLDFDEVACHVRAADVAAFPYHRVWESGSLRVALALGCPVVTTDVGGLGEVIRDRVTGRLVPPRDSGALARALADTLADPESASRQAAAALAEERATRAWPLIAAATAELYRRLTSPTSGG